MEIHDIDGRPHTDIAGAAELTGRSQQTVRLKTSPISMLRQVHRKDPTATQQARGIQQLALTGMDDNDIARRTGYDREEVRAGRKVATLDKNTTDRTHALGLDLTQVAALAQFTDRPDWIEHLLEQAEEGPFAFARALERTRRARAALDAQTSRHTALTEAGISILAAPDPPTPTARSRRSSIYAMPMGSASTPKRTSRVPATPSSCRSSTTS